MDIKIKANTALGALDAETDTNLLDTCFMDKGDLHRLIDVEDPAAIILGRTGSGKSALLYKIESDTNKSVRLDPNDISVRFLEYSNIIQFFDALGINLDLFYRLLWRHILTVELLKIRYDIKNKIDSDNFLNGVFNRFTRDKAKKKAVEYFQDWGDKFWLDTDEHLREITHKLEKATQETMGIKFSGINLSSDGANKLSDLDRVEVTQRASQVVNSLQIRKLNEVLNLLSDYSFDDIQKRYYVLIDQLDEDWANTETRCRFIRALIEEIKNFRKIKPVKIIIALRKDLLDLIFDRTRDSGFQQEKYESYILNLSWSEPELKKLIELRINEVFRSQYTNSLIGFDDLFPKSVKGGGQIAIDYLIERTLKRPRDILQFVNECFLTAVDRERISWRSMQAAEAQYSRKRLTSLSEEWSEVYPELIKSIEIIRGQKAEFSRSSISGVKLEDIMLLLYEGNPKDPCVSLVKKFYDSSGVREAEVLSEILQCLYKIGAVGLKVSTLNTFIWSYVDQASVSRSEVKRTDKIKVHKMLNRALDIHLDRQDVFDTSFYN